MKTINEIKCKCGNKEVIIVEKSNFKMYGASNNFKGFRYVYICKKCYKSTVLEYCTYNKNKNVIKVYN